MREMEEWEIDAKHRRIRGSNRLKYPGNEDRCQKTCGKSHCEVRTSKGRQWIAHRCFLAVDHECECQFSSECSSPLGVANVAA